ncbi:hypothetical protein TNCV_2282131 [Trichonephila clavipes]|nr:hypothetical protein TNCV_2282131 [Trichonephila clavipes]
MRASISEIRNVLPVPPGASRKKNPPCRAAIDAFISSHRFRFSAVLHSNSEYETTQRLSKSTLTRFDRRNSYDLPPLSTSLRQDE